MTIHHVTVLIGPEPFATERDDQNQFDSFLLKTNDTALFQSTIERTLLIEDDDPYFNDTLYERFRPRFPDLLDDTGQTLVADFDFGWPEDRPTSDVVLHGTPLSWLVGQEIKDDNGNRFVAAFPLRKQAYILSNNDRDEDGVLNTAKKEIFGNRQAVIIIPLSKVDGSGNEVLGEAGKPILSVFDKTAIFHDQGIVNQRTGKPRFFEYASKCFTQGSMIQTPHGLRAVETLQAGEHVVTLDNGLQPIIWVGHTQLEPDYITRIPHKWPIAIKRNALGIDAPNRDLLVSPQHRILVKSQIAKRMFETDEVLVAAKHLQDIPGIDPICPDKGVTYWHILLPQHDLVLSNGAWTESFFPGAYSLRTLTPETRAELQDVYPEIANPDFTPRPARRMLTGREGRKLAQRHAKNCKPLITKAGQSCLQAFEEEIISMA